LGSWRLRVVSGVSPDLYWFLRVFGKQMFDTKAVSKPAKRRLHLIGSNWLVVMGENGGQAGIEAHGSGANKQKGRTPYSYSFVRG